MKNTKSNKSTNTIEKESFGLKVSILLLLFFVTLFIGFSNSDTFYNGDSYGYYGLVKDVFINHKSYFFWSAAPGYNLFAPTFLFTYLVGFFAYSSPLIFFNIVNFSELILLCLSIYVFIYLNPQYKAQKAVLYLIPFFISLWNFYYQISNGVVDLPFSYTSLFMIFCDSLFIMMFGLFLNILHNLSLDTKISSKQLVKIIIFFILYYYLNATTLRYLSNNLGVYLFFLWYAVFLAKTSLNLKQDSSSSILISPLKTSIAKYFTLALLAVGFVGFLSFFVFETYENTSQYVFRGFDKLSIGTAFNIFLKMIVFCKDAFSNDKENFVASTMLFIVFVALLLGIYTIFLRLIRKKGPKLFKNNQLAEVFLVWGTLVFFSIAGAGILSGGVTFLVFPSTTHYFEFMGILLFAGISFIIAQTSYFKKHGFYISFVGLLIMALISLYHVYKEFSVPFKSNYMVSCINENYDRYNLSTGVGNFWNTRPIMMSKHYNHGLNLISFATQETNISYNFLEDIYRSDSVTNVNFVVYDDTGYKNNALGLISSYLPDGYIQNFTDVECRDPDGKNTSGILVLDPKSAGIFTKIIQQQDLNSKSWYALTNFSPWQGFWQKLPQNKDFVEKYHQFNYFPSTLQRTSRSASYVVNDDLSMTIANPSMEMAPVLSSPVKSSANGKYSIHISYSTNSDSQLGMAMVDVVSNQVIKSWGLDGNEHSADLDFDLNTVTRTMFVIAIKGQAVINEVSIAKVSK